VLLKVCLTAAKVLKSTVKLFFWNIIFAISSLVVLTLIYLTKPL